jgi:hypothetical protein
LVGIRKTLWNKNTIGMGLRVYPMLKRRLPSVVEVIAKG